MDNRKLVQPGHLNHYGFLFGGNMLKWVDEYAYIAACSDYPNRRFVTIAMDDLQFKKSVNSGDILLFRSKKVKAGETSVQYQVNVYRKNGDSDEEEAIFNTRISYVCVDETGRKTTLKRSRTQA